MEERSTASFDQLVTAFLRYFEDIRHHVERVRNPAGGWGPLVPVVGILELVRAERAKRRAEPARREISRLVAELAGVNAHAAERNLDEIIDMMLKMCLVVVEEGQRVAPVAGDFETRERAARALIGYRVGHHGATDAAMERVLDAWGDYRAVVESKLSEVTSGKFRDALRIRQVWEGEAQDLLREYRRAWAQWFSR